MLGGLTRAKTALQTAAYPWQWHLPHLAYRPIVRSRRGWWRMLELVRRGGVLRFRCDLDVI